LTIARQLGRIRVVVVVVSVVLVVIFASRPTSAWSNGGPSSSTSAPRYGTHDWIAQHALSWIPDTEKQFLEDNLNAFLYGTELPDFEDAIGEDGIGDAQNHHVYYHSDGRLQDDAAARRARDTFSTALDRLRAGDYPSAARWAGTMAHYIGDLGVFGHVMGAPTDWGTENQHDDYETHVMDCTTSYVSYYDAALAFDGNLEDLSAYDATLKLAHDTTFDDSGQGHAALWMDQNYDWNNSAFTARVELSLNLSVNAVADVLHTLWVEAGKPTGGVYDFLAANALEITFLIVVLLTSMVIILLTKTERHRSRRRS
jgi:hypothetical protein